MFKNNYFQFVLSKAFSALPVILNTFKLLPVTTRGII